MKIINSIKSLRTTTKILLIVLVIVLFFSGGTLAYNASKDEPVVQEVAPVLHKPEVNASVDQPEETEVAPPEVVEKPATTPVSQPEVAQWPVTYSLDQASSLSVVVNKKHKLPSNYVPDLTAVNGGQLRPEAAQALTSLLFKANEAGVPMKVISSYRSYDTQVATYNKWVQVDGQAQADRSSARAGHSEHQTGLAADLGMPNGSCDLEICFGSSAQGKWLAANAATYGFIIRYESDTESNTGYQYEPWHIRYLGVDIASAVVNSGKTLDQYYGVEAGGY